MARGGKRPGAGRPAGRPNKITADIKALAQVHAETAITELATILTTSESDQARIAAAKELLDRGFGKATQHSEITGKDGAPLGGLPAAGVDWLGYPIEQPNNGEEPV